MVHAFSRSTQATKCVSRDMTGRSASEPASERSSPRGEPASEPASQQSKHPQERISPLASKAALRDEAALWPAKQPYGEKRPSSQQSSSPGHSSPVGDSNGSGDTGDSGGQRIIPAGDGANVGAEDVGLSPQVAPEPRWRPKRHQRLTRAETARAFRECTVDELCEWVGIDGPDDVYKCGECHKWLAKVKWIRQTRGTDEGHTIMYKCYGCRHQWKSSN